MKKIMVFGTFDIFHKGHKYFLEQARRYGDYIIVVIARDKTVEEVKKKKPLNDEISRLNIVKKSNLAEKIVLGSLLDKYQAIKKHRPDVICLGYDQEFFVEKLKERLDAYDLNKTEVVRIDSYKPEIYKSSKFRKLLQ